MKPFVALRVFLRDDVTPKGAAAIGDGLREAISSTFPVVSGVQVSALRLGCPSCSEEAVSTQCSDCGQTFITLNCRHFQDFSVALPSGFGLGRFPTCLPCEQARALRSVAMQRGAQIERKEWG